MSNFLEFFSTKVSLQKPPQQTKISWGPKLRGPTFPLAVGNGKAQTGRPASLEDFFQERQAALGSFRCFGLLVFSNVFLAKGNKNMSEKWGSHPKENRFWGTWMDGWKFGDAQRFLSFLNRIRLKTGLIGLM